jgi:hypothetical protein
MAIPVEGIKPDIPRLAAELQRSTYQEEEQLRDCIVALYGRKVLVEVVCWVLAGLHFDMGQHEAAIEHYEKAFPEIFDRSNY